MRNAGGRGRHARHARLGLGLVVVVLAVLASGCAGDEPEDPTRVSGLGESLKDIQRLARQEGELNLVVWSRYAQRSWAGAFARQTGCTVNPRPVAASDEMVRLLRSGEYDGVSASGDVSGQLMEAGDVAPVDPALVPGYAQVQDGIKNRPHNSSNGRPYGVPHGRAANLLLVRTDIVPAATSWDVIWGQAPQYSGKISMYDGAMSIADAAVYLRRARPNLRIESPYQLNQRQFRAAVRLLRRQARHVGAYWRRRGAEQVRWYATGRTVAGTTTPYPVRLLEQLNAPVDAIKPVEGTTGRSDTWMIHSDAKNPNCMYLWMDYIVSPEAQAKIAELFGEAPVNATACELTEDPLHCAETHGDDETWWEDVDYWTTPAADCAAPARGEVCKTLEEWQAAWTQIRR